MISPEWDVFVFNITISSSFVHHFAWSTDKQRRANRSPRFAHGSFHIEFEIEKLLLKTNNRGDNGKFAVLFIFTDGKIAMAKYA